MNDEPLNAGFDIPPGTDPPKRDPFGTTEIPGAIATPCGAPGQQGEDTLDDWLERSKDLDDDRLRELVDADACFPRDAIYARRILGLLKRVEELESRLSDEREDGRD